MRTSTGAALADATLSGAYLLGTKLAGANLSGAILLGADLTRANLAGAKLGNIAWFDTICPNGTEDEVRVLAELRYACGVQVILKTPLTVLFVPLGSRSE